MTEQEAKRLEVPTEWNGKANVCTYCGRVPETFYVATGHDHTDYDIRWCVCRDGSQYKSEIETLRAKITELEAENEQLSRYKNHYEFAAATTEAVIAENEKLSLYKNLADEYGLSVFAELAELQKQRDELLARIDVVCEVHIISQTYDRIREERQFAADDIEYDLFASGWKAAIASVKETP